MEGGAENGNEKLKGKGAECAREQQRQEDIRKDQMYSGGLKGKGFERGTEPSDELGVGTILINRDEAISDPDNAEFTVESVTGEPGKRYFNLRSKKLKVRKGEESLKDAIERGVYRRKE